LIFQNLTGLGGQYEWHHIPKCIETVSAKIQMLEKNVNVNPIYSRCNVILDLPRIFVP